MSCPFRGLSVLKERWKHFENLTYFVIPKSGRKYSHTNSYNSTMTVIAQYDHLTAGAWAACANSWSYLARMANFDLNKIDE